MAQLNPERIVFDSSIEQGYKIAGFFYPSSAHEIKGVIQVCHGMAEFLSRFEEMIAHFNDEGFHVCGMDMPGHGETYKLNKEAGFPKGYYGGQKNGLELLLKDEYRLHELAEERFGKDDLKYFIFGHSMGSFVVRAIYSTPEYNESFDGYVFASTMGPNPAVGIGNFFAKTACAFGGKMKKNRFLKIMAFGTYCKRIPHPKSGCDWISSDDKVVKAYLDDPLCGFTFTNDGFRTLFDLITFMNGRKAFEDLSSKPCMFTYGSEDPVGGYGKGVEKVIALMKECGADVSSKNYGPYRHEIHNEPVKKEFFADLAAFYKSLL